MKTDHQLRDDILEELAWEPEVNDTEIGVEVKSGVVTLTGHVGSFSEKFAAERAVQRVDGVRGIAIEIDVHLPGDNNRTDSEIAHAAKISLDLDAVVPKDAVSVRVEDGHVTLTGLVNGEYQRRAAERDVRNLRGIKDVVNKIAVRPMVMPRDVKAKIESALQRRAHAEVESIAVKVEGSKITLSGAVPSWQERNAAVHAAWSAPGVTNVINHLVIQP